MHATGCIVILFQGSFSKSSTICIGPKQACSGLTFEKVNFAKPTWCDEYYSQLHFNLRKISKEMYLLYMCCFCRLVDTVILILEIHVCVYRLKQRLLRKRSTKPGKDINHLENTLRFYSFAFRTLPTLIPCTNTAYHGLFPYSFPPSKEVRRTLTLWCAWT